MHLKSSEVFMTDADDQKVILDVAASRYLTANDAGRVILNHLQRDVSLDLLVNSFADHFGIDRAVAARDCLDFLRDLQERGWLVLDDGERIVGAPGSPSA